MESSLRFPFSLAGSETTATSLSGIFYYLLQNQAIYERLRDTIRTSFASEKEVNNVACGEVKYLDAVIEESLRLYPPVPLGLPRVVPKEGDTVAGRYIPGNVSIIVSSYIYFG